MNETGSEIKGKSSWLYWLLNGFLILYFLFFVYKLFTPAEQVKFGKIALFFMIIFASGIPERIFNTGRQGQGEIHTSRLRFLLFWSWYTLLLSCAIFYLFSPKENIPLSILGGVLIAVGLGIRIWSMKSLARNFSTNVETWEDHELVQSGLYRLIRHPIYLGSILMGLGYPLLISSYWALLFSILFLILIVLRISEEEIFLLEKLPGYKTYCSKTKHLFPFLWLI